MNLKVNDILKDIKTVIRKEGKDELRYDLSNDHTLVVEVLIDAKENMEIAVERLDMFGNTVECSTDDYLCDDQTLTAMIENALFC